MPDWAQIISDALDILKFDGAVQDTLAEFRRKWGAQVPALLDERFDAIGIQYMKLPHEKGERGGSVGTGTFCLRLGAV